MKELLFGALLFVQGIPQAGVSGGSVSGRILGVDGTPSAGVRVTALAAPDSSNRTSGVAVIVSIAQTDTSGRFRLESIPPGRYFITAGFVDFPTYYPGVAGAAGATAVTVTSGSSVTGMDFAIARGTALKISGRVIREGDQLSARPQRVLLAGQNVQTMTAIAPDGSFQFSNVRPGTYSILLSPANGSSPRSVVVDDKDIVVDLTEPATATVTGSVVVEGGGLLPQVEISFEREGPNRSRSGISVSTTGTFSTPLPAGDYRLLPGTLPAGYTYISITAGATDLLKEPLKVSVPDSPPFLVTLGVSSPPPWVKVAGKVTDSSNNPRAVSTVSLIGGPGRPSLRLAPVKADGSFEFPMVLPGAYSAGVSSPGSTETISISVTVGKVDISDFKLAIPSKTLTGRILVEGGGPIPQLTLNLRDDSVGTRISNTVSPQSDGMFTMTLPGGQMVVSLNTLPPGYFLKSMTYGTADVQLEPLQIKPNAPPSELRITLGLVIPGR